MSKKYVYITENLNYGIRPEDEFHILRYDLKGSTVKRFVTVWIAPGMTASVSLGVAVLLM